MAESAQLDGDAGLLRGSGEAARPIGTPAGPTVAAPPALLDPDPVSLSVHLDLAEVAEGWRQFEADADCTAFQTFDRLAKWQAHIGAPAKTRPVIVVGRDAAGETLFILPFAISARGPVRSLTWLGSDLSDYNAPVLAPRFAQSRQARAFPDLWRKVLTRLRQDARFGFDIVDFQKMPETVGNQPNPFVTLPVSLNPSGAYLANLGTDWEGYYAAKRSSSTRRRERRHVRQLSDHGELRFVEVNDPAEIVRTLSTLFDFKTRSFARMGVDDVFARAGHRAFFLDLATDPRTRDLAQVTRLDIGRQIVAANIGLRHRQRYYLILSSYTDGDLSRFGPGRAHLYEVMRNAIGGGFRQFDFTIGDEPYKRDWSDVELRLFDHMSRTSLRGAPVTAVAAGLRRAKRFVKQNPQLWHAFSKARARLGHRTKPAEDE